MPGRPAYSEIAALRPELREPGDEANKGLSPRACLARLPDRYFAQVTRLQIAEHVAGLCALSADRPFHVDVRPATAQPSVPAGDGNRDATVPPSAEVTVLSFDAEGMLGLLTGILGATGFDIQTGWVYTLAREAPGVATTAVAHRDRASPTLRRRGSHRRRASTALPRRRIVDRFVGSLPTDLTVETFTNRLTEFLEVVIPGLLPGGDHEAARRMVNEAVADRLRSDETAATAGLLPVDLAFEPAGSTTRVTIVGEDTPFFLYSLSTAMSLQGVNIESVQINTERHVIRDELELARRDGRPITDSERLDRIRLSVLLTKQFTYFLGGAPDPYAALRRFEALSREIVTAMLTRGVAGVMSQPLILQELARLLGTSDFLWEDFIRGQYENIIPMLDRTDRVYSTPSAELESRLERTLDAAPAGEPKRAALNEFKDTEAFLIDLDHILERNRDFFFLSDKLTHLADVVVRGALGLGWAACTARYGMPRTVAGLPVAYAVFGLGKLGGRAIGYASDLELLFVYGDDGTTDGSPSLANAEFFERFFTEAAGYIRSKREGIFHVDLRLRPYGNAGPHAVSLESFNRYYGRDGDAHSYERLALTRLRFVAGDRALGTRIERLRDDLVYGSDSISPRAIGELRRKQLAEKASGDRLNAKFSPGALVDLEYGLQILLVQHGRSDTRLRTPSLHEGLDGLAEAGVMDPEEANRLVRAYRFLRTLINGLRMLRGNAQDLFLPQPESLEFQHLARRMGYRRDGNLSPADQLRIEFHARTAAVRAFLERHLGRDSIPGKPAATAADLVLSDGPGGDLAAAVCTSAGIQDPQRALVNVRSLAGSGARKELFSELIILAWSGLAECSDADMALNNWERYVSALSDPDAHFRSLLRQPAKLGLMLDVFSASQFLAETLIGTPAYLEWALDKSVVVRERTTEDILTDLQNELADGEDRRAVMRWFRQREILRIGTRDICLHEPIEIITRELSALAIAVVRADLAELWRDLDVDRGTRDQFAMLAFGKLGGRELNYSSDIDLLGICDDRSQHSGRTVQPSDDRRVFALVLERLRADLSQRTEHGYAFRVDFRLRPYGGSGPLVQGFGAVVEYYRASAAAWEHQALIKLSPIAGNLNLGTELLEAIRPSWVTQWDAQSVIGSISRMRAEAVRQSQRRGDDIKSGEGGIRDVEFTVQGLQMIHGARCPEILTGNTFRAIRALASAGIMTEHGAGCLLQAYSLLRRVEHFLQIYEDRQVHSLPSAPWARHSLARRIAGSAGDSGKILDELDRTRKAVRELYETFLRTGTADSC